MSVLSMDKLGPVFSVLAQRAKSELAVATGIPESCITYSVEADQDEIVISWTAKISWPSVATATTTSSPIESRH